MLAASVFSYISIVEASPLFPIILDGRDLDIFSLIGGMVDNKEFSVSAAS